MVTPLCLTARTFLKDLPPDLRGGWCHFLDLAPEVETFLESRTLPALETYLTKWSLAETGSLMESEMIREGWAGDIMWWLAGSALKKGLSTGPGLAAAGLGAAAAVGGGVYGASKLSGAVDDGVDWVSDMLTKKIDQYGGGTAVGDMLKGIVKQLAKGLKDLGMPVMLITGVMKMFGAEWNTVGGVVGCIVLLYSLYQLVQSKGVDTAEKVAQGAVKNPQIAQTVSDKVEGGNQPLQNAAKVLDAGGTAAQPGQPQQTSQAAPQGQPQADMASRVKVYRDAETYIAEKYNMGFVELRNHLVEAHGSKDGMKRFKTVSRIALAKAMKA